jgi:acid phosphatase class B
MNLLSRDIENIIFDYKLDLEISDKFKKVLKEIKNMKYIHIRNEYFDMSTKKLDNGNIDIFYTTHLDVNNNDIDLISIKFLGDRAVKKIHTMKKTLLKKNKNRIMYMDMDMDMDMAIYLSIFH